MSAPRRSTWPPRPRHQTISRTAGSRGIPERHHRTALGFYRRADGTDGSQQDRGKDTLTRLAALGTLSRTAGEGPLERTRKALSCTAGEGGHSPRGLGG